MYKVLLINMPFANIYFPSIGLTQLKSVVDSKLKDKVSVDVVYLNNEFAHYIGAGLYDRIANSMEHHTTGLGDWFFRQVAFPEQPDNTESYFQRCYPHKNERIMKLKKIIQEKRQGLDELMSRLIEKYHLADADMVGFTSVFNQNVACLAMARKLKEVKPEIITVMGGANCEAAMGKELAKYVPSMDYIFSGPALKSFPTFVEHCLDGDMESCNRIHGVFSKANCSIPAPLVTLGNSMLIRDIGDELDINTRVGLDYEPFLETFVNNFPDRQNRVELMFETSRGCWWGERSHCTFCGLNGLTMNYRAMNPENAIEQFNELFSYASRVQRFQCVDNIMPRNYIKEVLPYLETPPNATIFYEVKADLKAEEVEILSKAGVKDIQPGIEALNTSTLKLMKKGTSAFQNILLLMNCAMYEVRPSWNLLVGFPGEKEEVFEKYVRDIPLLTHLTPPTGAYPIRFDRFSPYFKEAKEYGLELKPVDFYELTYPFSKDALDRLAYYFVNNNFNVDWFLEMAKWINPMREKIAAWRYRWYGDDQPTHPGLFFKDGGNSTIVYDSRTSEVVEHDTGEHGKLVLETVSAKPRRAADIVTLLSHVPDLNIEKEIKFLRSRGLIFEENDRLLSLVHPKEPPAPKLFY